MEQNRKPRDLKELTSAALKVYAQEEREAPVLAEVRTLEAEIYRLELIAQRREHRLLQLKDSATEEYEDTLDGLSFVRERLDVLKHYQDKLLLEHYREKAAEGPTE